jgi:predicted flap endonuclease-1-like 5' DNA nuclease
MNFQEILNNIFSFGNSYEAIVFSLILIITMLLGVFFTYLVFAGPALRKKRKAIAELQSDLEIANSKVKLNEEKYTVQVSKSKRLEEEITKLQVQTEDLLQKNNQYLNENNQLQFEKESLEQHAENTEKEILELKNLYKISLQENSTAADRFAMFSAEKNEALSKLEDYKNLVEQLEKERNNTEGTDEVTKKLISDLSSDSERFEKEKALLKEENNHLQKRLSENEERYLASLKQISILQQQLSQFESNIQHSETEEDLVVVSDTNPKSDIEAEVFTEADAIEPQIETFAENLNNSSEEELSIEAESLGLPSEIETSVENILDSGQSQLIDEIINTTGIAAADQQDNLQLINGINSELEGKLYEYGIRTYEQLSRLNEAQLNQKLCQLLQLKDKTIENDQWEAQARQLLIKQKINNLTKDINLSKLFKK